MRGQKSYFLEAEGNQWFVRNKEALQNREYSKCLITNKIHDILRNFKSEPYLLEIGCGSGHRLRYLQDIEPRMTVKGLDPSSKAVEFARNLGVEAIIGTADDLPYHDNSFDVVILGFCLYLCDREDLFSIAKEVNRVLKDKGWIIIHDFYSEVPIKREYHHLPGLFSYKMDYRKLFDWHPNFTCYSHEVLNHSDLTYTDDSDEWTAISIIRKK